MLKELLKTLYKAKPELVEEHKRLVETLRSGSKKEQLKEAKRQLEELKNMVDKADRCWEGYEPVPGKKPYEKGSCAPIKKEDSANPKAKDNPMSKLRPGVSQSGLPFLEGTGKEVADVVSHYAPKFPKNQKPNPDIDRIHRDVAQFVEENKHKPPFSKDDGVKDREPKRSWKIKIKGKPGYHEVKDVLDMGSQQHNSYVLHDGSKVDHQDVEDLDITGKSPGKLEKSNYAPKGMGLYNQVDNIKRKSTRTGEVVEDAGQNKAVRQYTSAPHGTAAQQASRQSAADKRKSSKNPVRSMKDMSQEELDAIKAKYAAKSEDENKVAAIKAKYSTPKEKSFKEKVEEIKEQHADKPEQTQEEKIEAIKSKYSKMLKSDQHMQRLAKDVSKRQPTDAEFKVLLEYNSKIAQDLSAPMGNGEEDEVTGY